MATLPLATKAAEAPGGPTAAAAASSSVATLLLARTGINAAGRVATRRLWAEAAAVLPGAAARRLRPEAAAGLPLQATAAVVLVASEAPTPTVAGLLLVPALLVPTLPAVLPGAVLQAVLRLLCPRVFNGEQAAQPQTGQGAEHLPARGPGAYDLGELVELRSIH